MIFCGQARSELATVFLEHSRGNNELGVQLGA